ncbi:MAG: DUF1538 domain-containing protein [Spirochaetales bacterium]|jgi:hypothetical protein|nr:DUF1538 domain-containing protein [Spirochaetales bacterium]
MTSEQKKIQALASPPKVYIPFPQALKMVRRYAAGKLLEQLVATAFISVYLLAFQIIVLRITPQDAAGLAIGMGCVIVGLSAFIEGLLLGVMPVGEKCGLRLPQAVPLPILLVFAVFVGLIATVAEPSVGVLKLLGAHVNAWEAPLLFMLLNSRTDGLVRALSVGMGSAVLMGVLRYYYRFSLKPFLFILMPVILAVSVYAFRDPKTAMIISLAWDAGGVVTGPVTVPLILSLGLGISRTIGGGKDQGMSGFGVVSLASAAPILAVLIYGIILAPGVPDVAEKSVFFAPDKKEAVAKLFTDRQTMYDYVFQNLENANVRNFLGGEEYAVASQSSHAAAQGSSQPGRQFIPAMVQNLKVAAQAIITLVLFLFVVMLILNKGKVHGVDEIFLGVVLSVIGMAFLSFGIDAGLSKLGDELGRYLPTTYKAVPANDKRVLIPNFTEDFVETAIQPNGETEKVFLFMDDEQDIRLIPYNPRQHNAETSTYTYIPDRGPIFGGKVGGYIAILVFAFFMGITATMAEPALKALAVSVEEVSVGTFKKTALIQAVAAGVGVGMPVAITKILYDVPIIYYLVPGYLLILFLSAISSEDFVTIAWDSAGVTTGPITVPLVISLGLGIGGEVGVIEGFGVIAIVSIFPILFVLATGLALTVRRRAALKD